MDLEGIRLLIRVVELGSIQRAAHAVGMSRSSLRRKLENLEAEVGCELFVRTTVGVALTPSGAVVLDEGRALLERFSRMVSNAKSSQGNASGDVLVVLPLGVPDAAHIALLRMIHAVAPGVCVCEIERAEPLDHLHEPFDLLFHFGDPPERGRWFSRVITRVPLSPLASESYLREHGTPTSVADLARHRLLGWQIARDSPREWPLRAGGTVPIEPILCSRNGQMLHRAAQEGMGILLGDPNQSLLTTSTPLVPVLPREIGRELTLRCLSPVPGEANPRTRVVFDTIDVFLARNG